MIEFDHIAISGNTLGDARSYVEDVLGVELQPGGEHDVFHTHNALLGLEDGLYLEAIAVNPHAPKPERPRWFDLDRFEGAPRLTNWICRSERLGEVLEKLPSGMGEPVSLQRGSLRWSMAVPTNGILPFDNCAPALIEWFTTPHPAFSLKPSGVRLLRLTVKHPEGDALQSMLNSVLSDDRITFEAGETGLAAEFETPHGRRMLL